MEKWLRVSLCLVLSFTHTAFAEVMYLHAQCNASIAFSCVSPNETIKPFAFSLNRSWLNKEEVLYHNFQTTPSVKDERLAARISDRPDVNGSVVNVSIGNLQSYDTDMYECVFHYDKDIEFHNLPGKSTFFLYVQEPCPNLCTCTLYTPLLFSLSAAAGLLFFIILILTAVHCARTGDGGQMKLPTLQIPIYEEMNGVREKGNPHAVDDDGSALYVRPKKENPYIN